MAERLDTAYRARDILRRRELVYAALAPEVGDRILDVGCGPGYYVSEVLDRVGQTGSVTGVDSSQQMLAIAAERCAGRGNVMFKEGDAAALPVAGGTYDAALSVQASSTWKMSKQLSPIFTASFVRVAAWSSGTSTGRRYRGTPPTLRG